MRRDDANSVTIVSRLDGIGLLEHHRYRAAAGIDGHPGNRGTFCGGQKRHYLADLLGIHHAANGVALGRTVGSCLVGRIGNSKGILASAPEKRNPRKRPVGIPALPAGGRCSRVALAAPPARRDGLPQWPAARCGTAMRSLDRRLRMGEDDV